MRTVRLVDLPEFGIFWTRASGRRGLLLEWHYKPAIRERTFGKTLTALPRRWAARAYLMAGRAIPAGKVFLHPDLLVDVDPQDDTINTNGRGDPGDPFRDRWQLADESGRRPARSVGGMEGME